MFNWEILEPAEYQRSVVPELVELTTRSYITAEGRTSSHTADDTFLALAAAVEKLAATIADSPNIGIEVDSFKSYRPYPVQAVWIADGDDERFKIWLKQPLFIHENIFEAAKKIANLAPALANQIHFEHLTEGTEIQATGHGEAGSQSAALQSLKTAIEQANYQPRNLDTYRELYLDGLPLTDHSDVLFRLEIDPAVGNPKPRVSN